MAETKNTTVHAAKCYLKDGEDNDVTFRYSGINPETNIETVKSLCKALAENGSIFDEAPVTAKKAELITTETTTVSEEIADDQGE